MRRLMVAGNWKMNGSRQMAAELLPSYISAASDSVAEVLVCPPYTLLSEVFEYCRDSALKMGGQNISSQRGGAFTGDVSGSMLRDVGCSHVIVGHSERRELFGETDAMVAGKVAQALECGLQPLVCVGETLVQREQGETERQIATQLDAIAAVIGIKGFDKVIIAYEPVWAIGTGKTAAPEQAQAVHAFIRGRIANSDEAVGDAVRILYGGSVNADSAAELFAQPDIDGGLIGGASLKASDFGAICSAAG